MCKILDYAYNIGFAEGLAEAKVEFNKKIIIKMIDQGYSKDKILDLYDEVSEELYNTYLNEYKQNKLNN